MAPRRGFREKAKVQETSELHGDLDSRWVSLAIRQGLWPQEHLKVHPDSLTSITLRAFRLEEAPHREVQTPPVIPEGQDPYEPFQILEYYRFSLQL